MDDKQFQQRYDTIGTKPEWLRSHTERKLVYSAVDSPVDPASTSAADKAFTRNRSPKHAAKERDHQMRLQSEHVNPHDGTVFMEQNEKMERQLQQSVQLLNQKKHMQHQLLIMQQKQYEQHRQFQQQQQHNKQQLLQQQQQQRQFRQRSPDRQDHGIENQAGMPRHQQNDDLSPSVHFSESFENVTVHDLFVQCQKHLNVINACTDLQQTIKDEMKKQAKLDNIICQKLSTKAHRLQQQAVILEKAHAPAWVGPALHELANQVTQQAEMHHVYTGTLVEQCVVIQHSLDGHHELMKSVLAQTKDKNSTSSPQARHKSLSTLAHAADKMISSNGEDELRSMTFLQASNIFEGIRKPRMKLLSSLEYHQEQLNATLAQLNQVQSEIESLSKIEESDNLMWRIHLQKKDLEVRKEFLETRKEQLESDVQFARMDLNDFEYANKDSMLEVLNVFRQHRVRYDSTLRQSFQLLKAASLRDINVLRRLTKKSDLEMNAEREPGDNTNEVVSSVQRDNWTFTKMAPSQLDTSAMSDGMEDNDGDDDSVMLTLQNNESPQLARSKTAYKTKVNTQEQNDSKSPVSDMAYPNMLSSDSEISFINKTELQRNTFCPPKQSKKSTNGSFSGNHSQNGSDFNFSRADSSTASDANGATVNQDTDAVSKQITQFPSASRNSPADSRKITKSPAENEDAHATYKKIPRSPAWNVIKESVRRFSREVQKSEEDNCSFIITKYINDVDDNNRQSPKGQSSRGLGDSLIVSRGLQGKQTLGNFENSINTDCSVHCLYAMESIRDTSYNKDEKRVAHLISKYASSSRSNRSSMDATWRNARPLMWYGISNGNVVERSTRVQMSRSLKRCDLLTPCNVLTEYNENKRVNSCELLMNFNKGKNKNNSEYLKTRNTHQSLNCSQSSAEHTSANQDDCEQTIGQNSCEILMGYNSCEPLTGHIVSQSSIDCESLSCGHNNNVSIDIKQYPPGQNMGQDENLCDGGKDDHCSQAINSCESAEVQPSPPIINESDFLESQCFPQLTDGCEITSGHASRNLNNCLPLKNHIVDAESIQDREDLLDFEMNQVLVHDSHPRNIRVCAVRPIPSDSEDCGTGITTCTRQKNKNSKDIDAQAATFGKYDNLKLYEVTAGKFIVSDHESESTQRNTRTGTIVNCSNNKQADFFDVSVQTCPNTTCLKKAARSSPNDHKNKSLQCGMECEGEQQPGATEHDAEVLCRTSPLRIQNQTLPQYVSVTGQEQHTVEGNLQSMPIDSNEKVCGIPPNEVLPSNVVQKQQSLSHVDKGKSEVVQVLPTVMKEIAFSDRLNDEETVPKTVYLSSQFDLADTRSSDLQICSKPIDTTERSDVPDKMQCNTVCKTKSGAELAKYPNLRISDYAKDGQRVHDRDPKQTVNNEAFSYLSESGRVQDENKKAPSTTYEHNETNSLHSTQSGDQINATKEFNENVYDASWSQKPECCTEQGHGQSAREIKGYTNNPPAPAQSRPLKSSLKKSSIAYSYKADNEGQGDTELVIQCGSASLPSQINNAFCLQRNGETMAWQQLNSETAGQHNTGKIQKCIKQVRFNNRIHYDDNTEVHTPDENIPDELVVDSLNTNKNCVYCTKNIVVNNDEMEYFDFFLFHKLLQLFL